MTIHGFLFGPLQRDDSHEAGCSCGVPLGSFDYREDAEKAWRRHVEGQNTREAMEDMTSLPPVLADDPPKGGA